MGGIGLLVEQFPAAFIVEIDHPLTVTHHGLGRTHVLDAVPSPQAILVAEGGNTAVGRNTGTGKHYDMRMRLHGLKI